MATPATSTATPTSASPAFPRATANMVRKRKPVTSAGPRSFNQKNIPNAPATAHITGSAWAKRGSRNQRSALGSRVSCNSRSHSQRFAK